MFQRLFESGLLHKVVVSEVVQLSERFALIGLQGGTMRNAGWSPGDKLQIKVDAEQKPRTYTPIDWDWDTGSTHIVAYAHGSGPGSAWTRAVTPGEERLIFGPRPSMNLGGIERDAVLFGDETSFGLATAWHRSAVDTASTRYVFEVDSIAESTPVLEQLGIARATLIERKDDSAAHLGELDAAVNEWVGPASTCVLSGDGRSVAHLHRALKARGVDGRRLRTKVYWTPGKSGLD